LLLTTAHVSGEKPSTSVVFTGLSPWLISASATAVKLLAQAIESAVSFMRFCLPASAPRSSSSSTTLTCPPMAASISTVVSTFLSGSTSLTSAPKSR